MPIVWEDPYDIGDDAQRWKTGGGGGGNIRFQPPGQGVGGGGGMGAGGGGGIGFDYEKTEGFDPYGEQRRRMAKAFGRAPQRLGDQQPMGGARIDPQMIQKLLAMFGGGGF